MGIKFLGTDVTGTKPTASQLGLRELAINLADKKIFTNDGTNIIELGLSAGSVAFTPNTKIASGTLVVNSAGDALYISPNTYTTGASLAADIGNGSLMPVSKATKTLAWTAGTTYTPGQMVYGSGGEGLFVVSVPYTSGTDIPTDIANQNLVAAVTIPSETGGIAFSSTQTYKSGDIVTYNGTVYTFNTTHSAGAWIGTDATPVGITGQAYDGSVSYSTGDVVTESGIAYIAKGTTTIGGFNIAEWDRVGTPEKGGIIFDSASSYAVGDMVTQGGVAYQCISAVNIAVGTSIAFDSTQWSAIGTPEVGGLEHDLSKDYVTGNIVSDDFDVYVALKDNTGVGLVDAQTWHNIDSVLHGEGTHEIAAGSEYPTGGKVGGVWHIDKLGLDANGDKNIYTMTSGNLTGVSVVDSDEMIWVDTDASGNPIWFLRQYPKHVVEKGGVGFSTAKDYVVGDIVSNGGKAYIANKTVSVGSPFNPLEWDIVEPEERVGIDWAPSTAYKKGDIVVATDGVETYIVMRILAGTSHGTYDASEKAEWSTDIVADPGTY